MKQKNLETDKQMAVAMNHVAFLRVRVPRILLHGVHTLQLQNSSALT